MGIKVYLCLAAAVVLLAAGVLVNHWRLQANKVPALKAEVAALEIERDVLRGEVDSYSTELQKLNSAFDSLQLQHSAAVLHSQALKGQADALAKKYEVLLRAVRETPPPPTASSEQALGWLRANLPEGWVPF